MTSKEDKNPFNNIIQLEEITHFKRDHKLNPKPKKSILSIHKSFKGPKKVSYANPKEINSSKKDASDSDDEICVTSAGPSNSKDENKYNKNTSSEDAINPSEIFYYKYNDHSEESDSFTEESESDTEFNLSKNALSSNSKEFRSGNNTLSPNGFNNNTDRTISDENLFPVSSISVTRVDVLFAFILFLINFGELSTDFTLAIWHFQNGQKWACGLTFTFIALGGLGMLQQFGLLHQDQLDRLFRRGKRVRVLVNCFPIASTTIVSFQGLNAAFKSRQDPMQCQRYFKIDDLSRSLSRTVSLFQAAPQATLQLVVLIENLDETSWEKAMFTIVSVMLSLSVMTNANLPSKSDALENNASPSKAAYMPLTRIFVGMRMFTSLGSRCMGVTYLFVGCGCLLVHPDNPEGLSRASTFASVVTGIVLLLFPRLVFTFTDYFTMRSAIRRNLEHYREQPEIGVSSSHPIDKLPFSDAFMGYLATIFFPVGDPPWLFWYLWCEAGIFIVFGNVAGMTHNCLSGEFNGVYTTVFFIAFIIIPFVIPYIKAVLHKRKIDRFMRILNVNSQQDNSNNLENTI